MNPAAFGPVFVPAIALIGASIHIGVTKNKTTEHRLTVALLWGIVVAMGIGEVITAASHVVAPAATAAQIGWAAGSPFQWEVAMANLSFAVLGIACYWKRGSFWSASITGYLVYFWGCGVGHIYQYVVHQDTAPYNWGPLVPVVFVVPLVLAILNIALVRTQKRATGQPGAHERTTVPA